MMTTDTPRRAPRRRWTIEPWPWPGDSPEDKAKRIALSYRELTFAITQGHCDDPAGELHRLDEKWARHGHYWPRPGTLPIEPEGEDWYTAADLAHLLHKTPADIYRWARRGKIHQRTSADGSPEYSYSSTQAYLLDRRQKRAGIA